MAGKWAMIGSDKVLTDHKDAVAYCDGRAARAAATTPVNPHQAGSDRAEAWDLGVASKVSNPDDHGFCAPTGAAAT